MRTLATISGIIIALAIVFSAYELIVGPTPPCGSEHEQATTLKREEFEIALRKVEYIISRENAQALKEASELSGQFFMTCCSWHGAGWIDDRYFSICKMAAIEHETTLDIALDYTKKAAMAKKAGDSCLFEQILRSTDEAVKKAAHHSEVIKIGMEAAVEGKTISDSLDYVLLAFTTHDLIMYVGGLLAFAEVELYALNADFDELYEPGNPFASDITNRYGDSTGLRIPTNIPPPYILVIHGNEAIDLSTRTAPALRKLVTIITEESLQSAKPIHATPYTTLAYYMLSLTPSISSTRLPLVDANKKIIQSIGFGILDEVDIFKTPPRITRDTATIEEQQIVVHYRAAIESLSSLLYEKALSQHKTPDTLLQVLAAELHEEDMIDSTAYTQQQGIIDIEFISQDPMNLRIPNTQYLVRDILSLMDYEITLLDCGNAITFYKDNLVVNLLPIGSIIGHRSNSK